MGFSEVLDLADKSLQSLSFQEKDTFSQTNSDLPRITCLTNLTRLELSRRPLDAEDSIQMLRGLQLQELVLLECISTAQRLFVHGSLTTLRRLHIERSSFFSDESTTVLISSSRLDALKAAGDVILGLPHLHQISGACPLFEIGMGQGLRGWLEADLPEGTMVSDKNYHCCPVSRMKVWTKPDA